MLKNGTGDELTLTADGSYAFAPPAAEGTAYSITVSKHPLWQHCVVANGSGTVGAETASVAVTCSEAKAQVTALSNLRNNDGTPAKFHWPSGLAVDAAGNVYVAELFGYQIRKIAPTGEVTTMAGSGQEGSADGNGTNASFTTPSAIALDSTGTLYVTESSDNRIRKITPAGLVSTLPISFNGPRGVALDAAGNLYVTDADNYRIRKITPAGEDIILAGSGQAGSADGAGKDASFSSLEGIVVDAAGNVYVTESSANLIRKITPAGTVTTLAGSGQEGSSDGIGAAATFNRPVDIGGDAIGNLYVADGSGHKIRKITPSGKVTTLAGSGAENTADGIGDKAAINAPQSIEVAADGTLYVSTMDNFILKITPVQSP